MSKGKNQHVVRHGDGWAVIAERADRATKVFDAKQDAIDYGRNVARHQQSELVIHGRDGKIQNKDSHGYDPFPPRDKK